MPSGDSAKRASRSADGATRSVRISRSQETEAFMTRLDYHSRRAAARRITRRAGARA
jgi:hypothetical protein